jgi:hypothetical protein
MMNSRQDFEELGLPSGHGYPKMAYHSSTGSIIVHTQPVGSSLPSRRLSMRRLNEPRYRLMGDFPPEISVESFVFHPSLPLLYINAIVWSEHIKSPIGDDWDSLYDGNWSGIYCLNLDTLHSEILVRNGELIPPDGYRFASISTLFSMGNDGRKLFLRARLKNQDPKKPKKPDNHCPKSSGHYLSEFSIADRKLTIIAELKTVFA